jgi:hypothetical protein
LGDQFDTRWMTEREHLIIVLSERFGGLRRVEVADHEVRNHLFPGLAVDEDELGEVGIERTGPHISRDPLRPARADLDRLGEGGGRAVLVIGDDLHDPAEAVDPPSKLNPHRRPGADLEPFLEPDPDILDVDRPRVRQGDRPGQARQARDDQSGEAGSSALSVSISHESASWSSEGRRWVAFRILRTIAKKGPHRIAWRSKGVKHPGRTCCPIVTSSLVGSALRTVVRPPSYQLHDDFG